jgi:hypothetical protein
VVNDGDGTVVRSQVEVPGSGVLALAGGAMWLVGSAALPPGAGTVVLAVGIAATVWLLMQGGRDRGGPRLDRQRRGRVIRLVVVGAALVALGATLLRITGRAELTVPLAVGVCGLLLLPLASLLERRSLTALGGVLILLGAAGGVLALNTAGSTGPQGLVGLAAGLLLWGAAATQSGLTDRVRSLLRR